MNEKLRTNTFNEKGVDNEKVKRNLFSAILKMQKMHSELKSISEGIFFSEQRFFLKCHKLIINFKNIYIWLVYSILF